MTERHPEYLGPDDDEPGRADDYPIDDLEREAAGLPPLSSDKREINPPNLVHYSFLLWIAAAIALFVGFVLLLGNEAEIAASLIEANEEAVRRGEPGAGVDVTPLQIESGVSTLLGILAAGALMFSALWVLFAYKAREGTRSARTVLVALTLVLIAFVFGMPKEFVNFVQVLAVLIACAAAVLLFLPSVSGYFPRLPRTRRRWQDYS